MVNEWELATIGVLGDWYGGLTPSMNNANYWNGNIPWLSSGEIKEPLISKSSKFITELALRKTSLTLLPKGTIVIVVRSGILRIYFPVAEIQREMTINQDLKGIVVSKNFNSRFVLHLLTFLGGGILKSCLKSGTTVESVELNWLKGFEIKLPLLPEQRSIAAALSDVDAYIAALGKLIYKKCAVKQGAMQELLTGRRRLPGFSGEWTEKPLSEIADEIIMGQSPDSHFYNDAQIGLPLVQGNADIENRHTIIRFYTSVTTKYGQKNDTIMTVRAPVGAVAKADFDCCLGRGVCAMRGNEFLYQLLVYFEPQWGAMSTGSTFDSISGNELREVRFTVPTDKDEQTAIAEVLSDMDAEIDALMAKLNKAKHIKQGMMSELLTGRIRLIEQKTVADTVSPLKIISYPYPTDDLLKVAETEKEYNSGGNDNA